MSVDSITNLNNYASMQAMKTQMQKQNKKTTSHEIKTNTSKTETFSKDAVKIDIARIKEAAKQPIDEAEIQRRTEVRNALRDVDPSQALGQHINPERMAAEKEKVAKYAPIQNKMLSGQALTAEEKSFLREHYPELYTKAMQIEQEMEAFSNQLKGCKSKEEANRVYLEKKMQCLGAGKEDNSALFMLPAIDAIYRNK